ncbi:MAG: DNA recombination protein RmuC [Bacteroidetes bacterium]|nr:MAG: DNA recombination protein RmuC [Bacteroidota bacterium]
MEILFLIIGLIAGAGIGWLLGKNKMAQMVGRDELDMRQQEIALLTAEKATVAAQAAAAQSTVTEIKTQFDTAQKEALQLTAENSRMANQLQNLEEKLNNQKQEIETLQQRLAKEFENLANKIFEEKSEKFVRQNRDSLDIVLNPLKEKMEEFRKKVEDTHMENSKEQSRLGEQIRNLTELNQGMREDANRLTQALKGESKTQGNWGELILERILEKSGLTKGQEYTVQESFVNEDGRRQQPDVIIKLPDNKNLIVDSKVSLTAYERFSSAANTEEQQAWLKAHTKSIREHIKQLSDKRYQQLYEINSPDFVLMFVPIESAFAAAVQADPEIFNDAFEQNIVIVTTSTLLATLRTISSIWKQEYQNRNVLEIARQGGDLYDKFVSFTEDLIDLGKKMKAAQGAYEDSMKKLYEGRGNLIRRAETLRELGAKVSKQLDPKLVDRSDDL